jgi:hypothetical protein
MKNYQKILIPCAAAFVLSLSAFVSADTDSSFGSMKEQSLVAETALASKGVDVASSSVTFNSQRTKLAVSTSSTSSIVETNAVSALMDSETLDLETIVESYN